MDWTLGESIVLAPTGRDNNETETLSVNSTADGGRQVILNTPLRYTHHGVTENFGGGHTMDIR